MTNKGTMLLCSQCNHEESEIYWKENCNYDLNGKPVNEGVSGDHCICPDCKKLLHIDYDLKEKV